MNMLFFALCISKITKIHSGQHESFSGLFYLAVELVDGIGVICAAAAAE